MIEFKDTKLTNQDQIDLTVVLKLVASYFKRYRMLIYGFTVLGLIGGVFLYSTTKPTFKTFMVAKTDFSYLLNGEVISIIESLQKLRTKEEIQQLASKLNISEEKVKMIKKITAEPVSLESTPNYTQTSFSIAVEVSNNEVLDSLQIGIIKLLENTDYVKQRKDSKLTKLKSLQNKIEQELGSLDSVKHLVNSVIRSGKATSMINDPGNINARVVDLYEKMLTTEESIRFVKPIQIIEGFIKYKRKDGPRLLPYIAGGTAIGFMLSVFLILFILIRHNIHTL